MGEKLFKVGDKVRVLRSPDDKLVGTVGIVIMAGHPHPQGDPFEGAEHSYFLDSSAWRYAEHWLELYEPNPETQLRDTFAGQALAGMLGQFTEHTISRIGHDSRHSDPIVRAAYFLADAMMRERKK